VSAFPIAAPAKPVGRDGSLLQVDGLTVQYPMEGIGLVTVVDDVSFTIGTGESVALVGESGSGKTVTSLSIMGLVRPPVARVSGRICFDGSDLLGVSRRRLGSVRGSDVAMIFQEPTTRLNPAIKIGHQIAEVVRYHQGLSRRRAWLRAIELLEHVEIASPRSRASAYPHELSGGMCQRAMIAIALACSPKLLIADEPTTALDVTIQAQILELLKRLQAEYGMAMLFVTHDLGIAADICDRGIVMYAGQIVDSGRIGALFGSPAHPYTEGLLRAMPQANFAQLARGVRRLASIPGVAPAPWQLPAGCRFHPRCAHAIHGRCDANDPSLLVLEERATRCVRVGELDLKGVS
jgi:peptide/nickel transport system ATP-binding protein